ncbi:nucleoside recognition domain-containing protein [Methanococcus sp. CF]
MDSTLIADSFYSSFLYTLRISAVVLLTIYIVNYFVSKGLLEKISRYTSPVTKKLNLNSFLVSSILVSFFSPTVGYTMLADGIDEKELTETEVLAGTLANSFPAVLSHVLTYYVPVVIPILGYTGIIYVILRLSIAFMKSILGLAVLLMISRKSEKKVNNQLNNTNNKTSPFEKTFKFARRFVPVMFVSMFLVLYLSKTGFFNVFSTIIMPVTNIFNLNPNTGILAITEIINVSAAMVMAGTFLNDATLSQNEVLIGLIFGNIVAFSTRSVKHSIPLHFSLFGSKRGTKIILLNSSVTIVLDILIIWLLMSF